MIDVLLALLAGLATIAAPCILPMLPILLGTSVGQANPARPLFIALGFTATFSALALIFGLFASALGPSADLLRDVAIALLMTFGILMVWPRPFELLMARVGGMLNRADAIGAQAGSSNLGGLVLGMTIGVVWTPCAGPVLGSILTLVATADDLGRATVLLAGYAVGAGVPMLLIAYGGQYVSTRVRRLAKYTHRIQQVFGLVIIGTAVAMFYQFDTLITLWLANAYPGLAQGL